MPQSQMLIRFCNEKARPMFDIGESSYETAKRVVAEYTSTQIAAEISDLTNTERIDDGSVLDGRKALVVRELKALKTFCDAYITWYETTMFDTRSALYLVRSGSVNGGPRI